MALAILLAAAGCAPREPVLPGERLDPRAILAGDAAPVEDGAPRTVPLALPPATAMSDWTQPGGKAAHRAGHAALSATPQRVWSASIGAGEGRRSRISAAPVVAGGRVFAMDSDGSVTATGTGGDRLWQADLDGAAGLTGGGLATDGARVYATTGAGTLVALDAGSGAELWRQRFDAPVGAAPAIEDGRVFVVARDGSAWGVEAATGKVAWIGQGTPAIAGKVGAGAPAVAGDRVILPFSSGEVRAVARADGTLLWSGEVAGRRLGRAFATLRDFTGDPVIAGDTVYAATSAGRLAALDLGTGVPRWEAKEGAQGPVWPVGDTLFLVSDENRLVRLDAGTGATVWAVDLPYYVKEKTKRQQKIVVHHGPVLAGGRLWIASGDDRLRGFDPVSGALLAEVDLPGGAAAAPAVAGGTLYVVTANGQLHAFR
jgi:outer membrane protein assembly factor BamB